MVIGGVVPNLDAIVLNNYSQLKSEYFLQRREIGIINIGGEGTVSANGHCFIVMFLSWFE